MKLITIIVFCYSWIFCISTYSFGSFIDISQPYAYGKIKLTEATINDTIRFSNGVNLAFYTFFHPDVCSGGTTHWCFIFTDSTKQIAGYRYDTTVTISKYSWQAMGDYYFTWITNSSDTIWNNLTVYPDTLSPIDTFSLIYPYGPDFNGKHIIREMHVGDGNLYGMEAYNVIVYVCSDDNRKIALQFSNLLFTGISPKEEFQSITFNWAADSSGNGKFKIIDTSIIHTTPNGKKTSSQNIRFIHNRLYFPNTLRSGCVSIFNIRGQKVFTLILHDNTLEMANFPSGIYQYLIIGKNKKYHGSFIKNR